MRKRSQDGVYVDGTVLGFKSLRHRAEEFANNSAASPSPWTGRNFEDVIKSTASAASLVLLVQLLVITTLKSVFFCTCISLAALVAKENETSPACQNVG